MVSAVPRPSRLSVARAGVLAIAALVCGCVDEDGPAMRVDGLATAASLFDSYDIAHGMALSYAHSGRATRGDFTQLVRYDHDAAVAVVNAERNPGDQHDDQAEHALQALVNFTGTHDLESEGPL